MMKNNVTALTIVGAFLIYGRVPKWIKGTALKADRRLCVRGFESYLFRHKNTFYKTNN